MKVEIAKTRRVARERMPRQDGDATRQHILETAGRLYAEKGYARVTSKEICTRAGVNMASVNYQFGGKDGLYEAVLIEAHRQILSLEELERKNGKYFCFRVSDPKTAARLLKQQR